MEIHQRIKNRIPYGPDIPPPGTDPKNRKTLIQKEICTPMFTAALLIILKYRNNQSAHYRQKRSDTRRHIYIPNFLHLLIPSSKIISGDIC